MTPSLKGLGNTGLGREEGPTLNIPVPPLSPHSIYISGERSAPPPTTTSPVIRETQPPAILSPSVSKGTVTNQGKEMETLCLVLLLLSPAFAMPMRRLVSSSESSSSSESYESSSSSSSESYESSSSSSSESHDSASSSSSEEERFTPGTLAPPTVAVTTITAADVGTTAIGPSTEGSTPTRAPPTSTVTDAVTGCVTEEVPSPPPFTEARGDA